MAEAIPQTTTAETGSSVRAALVAAIAISAFTLSVATFELAMADWPSGFVLLTVMPLMALVFCGCALWSATLRRIPSGSASTSSVSDWRNPRRQRPSPRSRGEDAGRQVRGGADLQTFDETRRANRPLSLTAQASRQ